MIQRVWAVEGGDGSAGRTEHLSCETRDTRRRTVRHVTSIFAMATPHLARTLLVLLCWETFAASRLTKVNAKLLYRPSCENTDFKGADVARSVQWSGRPERGYCSLRHRVQTGPEAHPASFQMGTRDS